MKKIHMMHTGFGIGFEFETDRFTPILALSPITSWLVGKRGWPSKLIYAKIWITGLFTTSATITAEVRICLHLRAVSKVLFFAYLLCEKVCAIMRCNMTFITFTMIAANTDPTRFQAISNSCYHDIAF
jgi:hypothetical protein